MSGHDTEKGNVPYKKKPRDLYIDWLRTIAVQYVVFLHCIFTTDLLTMESQNNELFKQKKNGFFRYLIQFGIPSFFFISGIGASHFKTENKGSFCKFF